VDRQGQQLATQVKTVFVEKESCDDSAVRPLTSQAVKNASGADDAGVRHGRGEGPTCGATRPRPATTFPATSRARSSQLRSAKDHAGRMRRSASSVKFARLG
jgi:hypothetical protein